jgi:hypothetical protein
MYVMPVQEERKTVLSTWTTAEIQRMQLMGRYIRLPVRFDNDQVVIN